MPPRRPCSTAPTPSISPALSREKLERPPTTALSEHPAGAIGWISLCELARVLGRSNPRAARDWCNRHEVPYRRDGKYNFTRVEDVQRALEALPARADDAESATLRSATRAASEIMARRPR